MTAKQKQAFIKSEGWTRSGVYPGFFIDPLSGTRDGITYWELDGAYTIARRRKSARDSRRLKAAGFEYLSGKWWGPTSFPLGNEEWVGHQDYATKAEALSTLEAP
jgi:hypothetical protein